MARKLMQHAMIYRNYGTAGNGKVVRCEMRREVEEVRATTLDVAAPTIVPSDRSLLAAPLSYL